MTSEVMWCKNCKRKLSDLTYPPCRFNKHDNNSNGDNRSKNCNDNNNNDINNGNTDNKHRNVNNGDMHFCNSNVQCVINKVTNDTKIKLADNMWESLL